MKRIILMAFIAMVTATSCKETINSAPVLNLNLTEVELSIQGQTILTAFIGESASALGSTEVSWTSLSPEVAIVDERGAVTGLSGGVASIVATHIKSGVSSACEVKVLPDVYIAGHISPLGVGTILDPTPLYAALWKNGVQVELNKARLGSEIFGVTVSGQNVYVCGSLKADGSNYFPAIWTNGIEELLEGDYITGTVMDIAISGNDVYAVGEVKYSNLTPFEPVMWKNGEIFKRLAQEVNGNASKIFISGSDIYACGWLGIDSESYATVWKNGEITDYAGNKTIGNATDIFVDRGDVYVAGDLYMGLEGFTLAAMWRNGQGVELSNGTSTAGASGIYVYDSDIYTCGSISNGIHSVGYVWKNGKGTILGDDTLETIPNSIKVSGGDVYVSAKVHVEEQIGDLIVGHYIIRVWKNGTVIYDISSDEGKCVPQGMALK